MIDCHIHVIPGVDDGSTDIEMSIEMINEAILQGVSEIIATPHYHVPLFTSSEIEYQYKELNNALKVRNIAMKVHLGNEIHLNEETLEGINDGKARTLGDSDYLLIELPDFHFYPYHEAMLFDLSVKGYKIILAHVERYRIFRNQEDKLCEFVDHGVYGQMSSKFIINKRTRKFALSWIRKGYVHIIASDAHNVTKRPVLLKTAYQLVSDHLGEACAKRLFIDNPRRVLDNLPLEKVDLSQGVLSKFRNLFK